jgi:hypothetical protein
MATSQPDPRGRPKKVTPKRARSPAGILYYAKTQTYSNAYEETLFNFFYLLSKQERP